MSSSAKAEISVVVPTFNLEREIARTLKCLREQTIAPDEIVIVDDGSSDDTVTVVRAEAERIPCSVVKIIVQDHRGPGAARNRGIRESTGEWIAFLDGDDLWMPEKIARLRSAIRDHSEATIIAHDEYESDLKHVNTYKPLHKRFDPSRPLLPQLYRGNFLSTSCVAVRRDILFKVGGLDENLPSAQDYDLWLKLAREGRLVFIPEPLETYYLRSNSISTRVLSRYACMIRIASRHAPFVAQIAGWRISMFLRVRFLASVFWTAAVDAIARKRFRDLGIITFRLPVDSLRLILGF